MKSTQVFAAILLATTGIGGAYAADQATKPQTAQERTVEKAAEDDVGKLSKDGATAFRDLHDARLAIFNADPKDAKSLIDKAQTAIGKAKSDSAVYMKAENELDAKLNEAASGPGGAKKNVTDDTAKPVAWLPINGQLTLGEDFAAVPEKTAAVQKANEHVKKGDRKSAIETLKLADVDVNFTMAVLPLDKTAADIDQAAKLINDGKFYEANALLKGTEERVRFDMVDVTGKPTPTKEVKADTAKDAAASKTDDANAAK